jgi:HK97 family phage major capsid protein
MEIHHMEKIATLRAKRAAKLDELDAKRVAAFDALKQHAEKPDFDNKKDSTDNVELKSRKEAVEKVDAEIKITAEEFDAEIKRVQDLQDLERRSAVPVAGQDTSQHRAYATAADDDSRVWIDEEAAKRKGHITNKGLILAGCARMIGAAGGSHIVARSQAKEIYGEGHPVTKALEMGVGGAGGFIVPPAYVNEIIELLRPAAVVRSSNPRAMAMPRGTLTLPAQTAAATASYSGETQQISPSQQQLSEIIASYKKLTALVPVTNDLMRYADPAADAFVRDDLVMVMALREDLAFLVGDGAQNSPRGFTSFANAWARQVGTGTQAAPQPGTGIAGTWSFAGNSIAAVGGNFITSNEAYTLATVAQELGGLVNKLDTANVPDFRRMWFMHPRSWNYLNNVQNSLGLYVYRDELSKSTLLGYPYKKSTQVPINIWDATGANKDCSFVMLVEMTDALLLDSMTLELAVSREGTYYDSNNVLQSAFQKDQTLIRAIAEHDFQMRHVASVAIAQIVRWAPAIS